MPLKSQWFVLTKAALGSLCHFHYRAQAKGKTHLWNISDFKSSAWQGYMSISHMLYWPHQITWPRLTSTWYKSIMSLCKKQEKKWK